MRRLNALVVAALLNGTATMIGVSPSTAQVVSVTVTVAPPPLPIYVQPPIPEVGYLWSPGYWAWDDLDGYYWVPGTWVLPPRPGLLWTPGYWGWDNNTYIFHTGYWGARVGFYGGVDYGYGYTGGGYEGGYWNNGAFFYNRTVNNITNVNVTNVYNKTIVVNNNVTNVSYNGGTGGTTVRPTADQMAAAQEQHVAPTSAQVQQVTTARQTPALHLSANHGRPAIAATTKPGDFKGNGVVASSPKTPVVPPSAPNAAAPGGKPNQPGGPDHQLPRPGPGTATPNAVKMPDSEANHALPTPAAQPQPQPPRANALEKSGTKERPPTTATHEPAALPKSAPVPEPKPAAAPRNAAQPEPHRAPAERLPAEKTPPATAPRPVAPPALAPRPAEQRPVEQRPAQPRPPEPRPEAAHPAAPHPAEKHPEPRKCPPGEHCGG